MKQNRKQLAIYATLWVAAGMVILALIFNKALNIEYHKWRLKAAKEDYARYGQSPPTWKDEVGAFLGRTPMTSLEAKAVCQKHEQALALLGYLEYHVFHGPTATADIRECLECMQALARIQQICPWSSCEFSEPGTQVVVAVCRPMKGQTKHLADAGMKEAEGR